MTDVDTVPAERLAERVRGKQAGTITVLDARYSFDEDVNGDLAVFLDLDLSDPDESGTWPIDDVLALHRLVDEYARELLRGQPWHVRLNWPSEPDPDDDEEDVL